MASKQNSLYFYLNILEVSGKTIVDTYVNNMQQYLNKLGLKYTFDIITDEDFYINTMSGGAKSTFPYIHFERALNSMRDILPGSNRKKSNEVNIPIPDTNYDDNTITPEQKEDISVKPHTNDDGISTKSELVKRMLSYNPVDLDDTLSTKKKGTQIESKDIMVNIPEDYTGIMHILLTINVKNSDEFVSGGITQLNQFLEIYNKKEDD